MINKSILFLMSVLVLAACGGNDNAIPEDLEGRKALLEQKETELEELQATIGELRSLIETEEPPAEQPERLITTVPVQQKDFEHFVNIQGSVQSDDYVNVTSEVPGRIIQMNLKEGQSVRKGQLVATLDMEQVDKQIAELETALQLASDVFERQKRLWDQNIGSEIQFLEAKNNKERLEKSLETIRFQNTKSKIYAPISGVVEMVNLKSGEVVSPGIPIIQLLNTNRVKVTAAVPETYLRDVKKGEQVVIKFPALNKETTAKVSRIGTTIDPANRTFEVEVNLPNNNGLYKPNLLAEMLIKDIEIKDAITIPLSLMQQDVSGKSFVFTVNKTKEGIEAQKVFIKTGDSYDGEIVVTEGLTANDILVSDGSRGIADGEPVKISEAVTSK